MGELTRLLLRYSEMHFTVEAQNRIRTHFEQIGQRPLTALDATAGNGLDTLFLTELVGEHGRVVAIDIQESAIRSAQDKLAPSGLSGRVVWCCQCHSQLAEILRTCEIDTLDIAMFNLGYLPFGDKRIITKTATTLQALQLAATYLNGQGIMSILSYPGHQGGSEEHRSVAAWIAQGTQRWKTQQFCDVSNVCSPVLWLLSKHHP
jgi:SAM-dependent methyltransferase